MKSRSPRNPWWELVPLSILAVALGLRVVAGCCDRLFFDDYRVLNGVERSFSDYRAIMNGAYILPQVLHHWVAYRVFGGGFHG